MSETVIDKIKTYNKKKIKIKKNKIKKIKTN